LLLLEKKFATEVHDTKIMRTPQMGRQKAENPKTCCLPPGVLINYIGPGNTPRLNTLGRAQGSQTGSQGLHITGSHGAQDTGSQGSQNVDEPAVMYTRCCAWVVPATGKSEPIRHQPVVLLPLDVQPIHIEAKKATVQSNANFFMILVS